MSKPELAIGVRYLPSYPAPLVLFKAKGHQARRVLELARKHGIPESAQEDLAPLLFQLPEGAWIPEKHFAILAQLLTAVYHYGKNHHDEQTSPRR